jgi:hypothetical protein
MLDSSWLHTGVGFPRDGLSIEVEYRQGTGSSRLHLPVIGAVITRALHCRSLFEGSLNLWADHDVEFPEPAHAHCGGSDWLFVPVIIRETAVGVAARQSHPVTGPFIEVFSCSQLAPLLRISFGTHLGIRLLSGAYLDLAA